MEEKVRFREAGVCVCVCVELSNILLRFKTVYFPSLYLHMTEGIEGREKLRSGRKEEGKGCNSGRQLCVCVCVCV